VLRKLANLSAGALLSCVVCLTASGQSQTVSQRPAHQSAAEVPIAKGLSLTGLPVDPLAKGGTVVLIFMRTDCPVSNRYAPTIKALSRQYAGTARFFLVYPDAAETPANIEKHLKEFGLRLPPLRDPQHALVKLSKVEITPEVGVFNSNRELIYHGRIDNWYEDFGRARPQPTTHELDEAIRAAVAGSPAPASVGGVGCYISDLQ
jgi:thiol-disulfide isomerase/thioredoxin